MQRIALKLTDIPVSEVITTGRKILAAMGQNADRFPEPPMALTAIAADINDLEKLEQVRIGNGGKYNTVLLKQKLEAVKLGLDLLACYVQMISRGDEAIVNEAGMELQSRGPRKYDSIEPPQDVRIDYGTVPSSIALRWKRVNMARQYGIEVCLGPIIPDKWKPALYTSVTNALIEALPSGELASFRIFSLSAAGKSVYSEVVSRKMP